MGAFWEWKWPPPPLSCRAGYFIQQQDGWRQCHWRQFMPFVREGEERPFSQGWLGKHFPTSWKDLQKPDFQTLPRLNVKDILQFTDSNIPSWSFPYKMLSVVAWSWWKSQGRCACELHLFCSVASEDTVVAHYLATVKIQIWESHLVPLANSAALPSAACSLVLCPVYF